MTISTATLQDAVLRGLTVNSSDTLLLSRALEWLNESMDDILIYIPEAEFFQKSYMTLDTVASQPTYVLPSDFFYLNELVDVDNENSLNMLPREEFDRRHPDPDSEDEDSPADYTLEYDRANRRNLIRLAPIPDDAYTLKAAMRCWHADLSDSQDIPWDKLKYPLIRRAIYYGALEVYNSPDDAGYRSELGGVSASKIQELQHFLAAQKPKPRQIRVVLRKSDY